MKVIKWIIVLLCFIHGSTIAYGQKDNKKVNLHILYVGGSANWENEAFSTPESKEKDIVRRKASFEKMLRNYFTQVTVIDASAYSQSLSNAYDVTVMDGTPKAIAERQIIKDETGKVTKYVPAAYLTEDFDKPMFFIGELGERMGRSIGLKLDWYCLCLDAHAHHYRRDHPIFNKPFKVNMAEEVLPTPEDAFHYEYFLGKSTPKTLPMWRVQTKGYITDKNFRIGMVARPWGFEDSPEAESISSGVCAKTLDAVALGRHGNFFHWGFAASPEFMTDEAQVVMANAIAYIAQFDGKGVIARKYLDRRATKEFIKERKHYATREAYLDRVKSNEDFDKQMLSMKKKAQEKKAKGEKLTENETRVLDYTEQPKMSFEEFLKKNQKELFDQFGTDTEAYLRYYDDNLDYFYSEDASYVITVDEDVKSLGIPNTDQRLLDKCIAMLEKGQDVDKAKRILNRYTLANFSTAKEWRSWYEKNKSKIFFTQAGGFYFMVDSSDKDEPANNYKSKQENNTSVNYDKINPSATDHNKPVSIAAGVVDLGGDKKEIVVKVKIHSGYHIYADVSDRDPYIKSEIHINTPTGIVKEGNLILPSFRYFNDKGTTIYEDEVVFKQVIVGKGKGVATVQVQYQCCDSQICFPPVEEEIQVTI